jgi:hypothetical protein
MELVRLYSNPPWSSAGLLRLRCDALSQSHSSDEPAPCVPPRLSRRLGTATLERIVAEYVAGAPTTALTGRYRIGKGTVLRLLREHGVRIRHQHRR